MRAKFTRRMGHIQWGCLEFQKFIERVLEWHLTFETSLNTSPKFFIICFWTYLNITFVWMIVLYLNVDENVTRPQSEYNQQIVLW